MPPTRNATHHLMKKNKKPMLQIGFALIKAETGTRVDGVYREMCISQDTFLYCMKGYGTGRE